MARYKPKHKEMKVLSAISIMLIIMTVIVFRSKVYSGCYMLLHAVSIYLTY